MRAELRLKTGGGAGVTFYFTEKTNNIWWVYFQTTPTHNKYPGKEKTYTSMSGAMLHVRVKLRC